MASSGSATPTTSSKSRSRKLVRAISYQDVVLHIVNHLTDKDVRNWLFLRDDDVPPRHQDSFRENVLEFFMHMKRLDIYTEEKHHDLLDDLRRLQLISLRNEAEKMFSDIFPTQTSRTPEADIFPTQTSRTPEADILPTQTSRTPEADIFPTQTSRTPEADILPAQTSRTPEAVSTQPPPELIEQLSQLVITKTEGRCMSAAGTLQSTEPVATQKGQAQLLNVHPGGLPSNQSSRASVRKRPGGSDQFDPDVSPNEPSFEGASSPPPKSSKVGSSPAGAGQVNNYVILQQISSLKHPSDEPSIEARASPSGNDEIGSLKSSEMMVDQLQRRSGMLHPSDDQSVESRASVIASNQDDATHLLNKQPESTQLSAQPFSVQQESAQSSGPPDQPKKAWSGSAIMTSQGDKEFGSETATSMRTLHSTQNIFTYQSKSTNEGVYIEQYQAESRISDETGHMCVDDIERLFSPKDSLKDGRTMRRPLSDDVEDITDDLSEMQLSYSAPVNKEKREEEKEKDDEDEKEKCEKDFESEDETDEIDEVQNLPEAGASNIKHDVLDEENVYHEEKKEEEPVSDLSTFEASEGSWPALAVAQQLSDEKAKKEEEEAKIEYDPTTGIEKTLFEKMKEHPESLSSEEHDLIKKQMMQHLQKKANPTKKNEPELPFDPEGRLSEYQKELGVPGLMGFNYIICAPSRTGKVLTAATVCNHQRKVLIMKENKKPFKVLFVSPGDCIKERHRRAFEEVFPQGSVVALDSTSKFREVFDQPSVNVVMLTGARLSVALNDGDLKFVDVHTMVVDDCHLVASDHPGFGDVIKHYLLEKKLILARKAPKGAWTLGKPYGGISYVIGLTPHLGAGTSQFSKDNIVQQCGLLDSKGIRRVETVKNLKDLLDTNRPPQMDTILLTAPSSSSIKGTFRSVVEKIMCAIEEKFSILPETGEEGEEKKLAHPPYGTDMYIEWIMPMYNDAKLCKDVEKYPPAMYLAKLNEVLMVNEDVRPKEAVLHLKDVQKLKTDQDFNVPSGNTCHDMVKEQLPELNRLSKEDHAGLTPKLTCLAKKLAEIYSADRNALGLVICRCPAVATYLTKIISESNITLSKGILPKHLEEIGQCEDDGEESHKLAQQRVIIDDFEKDGSVNLVISTDFEQVDLELPDCHFVIRYNVACDEVGTIQWSGRKKAKKDLCFLITENGTMIFRQEETKREALKELEKYLKVLNDMDPKNWYDIVENKQLACLRNNAHRDFMVNFQRFCRRAADYTLLCRNCRKFICNVHFLLKRGTHVSCQDSSIKERFSVASLTTPLRGSEDDTTGVLKCTGQKDGQPCQNKLGLAIDFKRLEIEEGYGLDAKGFFFSFLEGQHADYVGKDFDSWDDVDFYIHSEERSDRRRSGGGGGGDDDNDDGMDDNRGGGSADGGDSKKKESGASYVGGGASYQGGGGGGGRTRTTEGAGRAETQMETETTAVSRRRRPNQDRNVDR